MSQPSSLENRISDLRQNALTRKHETRQSICKCFPFNFSVKLQTWQIAIFWFIFNNVTELITGRCCRTSITGFRISFILTSCSFWFFVNILVAICYSVIFNTVQGNVYYALVFVQCKVPIKSEDNVSTCWDQINVNPVLRNSFVLQNLKTIDTDLMFSGSWKENNGKKWVKVQNLNNF